MEQKGFEIHPHNGYLNTDFVITNNLQDPVMLLDEHQGIIKTLANIGGGEVVNVHLSAGSHKIFSDKKNSHDEIIIVEDAIKLGGGRETGAYVSPVSPWSIIKMTDRMYFHNTQTGKEFVEINLVPDNVEFLSSDCLLLHSMDGGYSVYSISSSKIVLQSEIKPLFHNGICVVLKVQDQVSVVSFDYRILNFSTEAFILNATNGEAYISTDKIIRIFSLDSLSYIAEINPSLPIVAISEQGLYIGRNPKYPASPYQIFDIRNGQNHKVGEIPYASDMVEFCSSKMVSEDEMSSIQKEFNRVKDTLSAGSKALVSLTLHYRKVSQFIFGGDKLYYRLDEHVNNNGVYSKHSSIRIAGSTINVDIPSSSSVFLADNNLYVSTNRTHMAVKPDGTLSEIDGLVKNTIGKCIIEKSTENGRKIISSEVGSVLCSGDIDTVITIRDPNRVVNLLLDFGVVQVNDESEKYIINPYDHAQVIHHAIRYSAIGDVFLIQDAAYVLHAILYNGTIIHLPKEMKSFKQVLAISRDGSIIVGGNVDRFGNVLTIDYYHRDSISGWDKTENILGKIYDSSSYRNVLFSGDGKYIVYSDSEGNFSCRNINNGAVLKFENEKFVQHINGYRSELIITERLDAKPRVIDPVSGQYLDAIQLAEYKFSSPDGRHVVEKPIIGMAAKDGVGYIEYFDLRTNSVTTSETYNELKKNYDSLEAADDPMISKRISLMKNYPSLFVDAIRRKISDTKRWSHLTITGLDIVSYINPSRSPVSREEINEAIRYFAAFTNDFVEYVIKRNEYVVVKNASGHSIRIDIGTPLWYLNYMSFSYDSRYIAIAGRFPDNTYSKDTGRLVGGLFLLFDLQSNMVVESSTDTNAVWVTAFTNAGDIAYYDSTPNTFFHGAVSGEKHVIYGRSFLTFSPSGKYFALSNQGYIRADKDVEGSWGHQPSTSVFLRSVDNPMEEIAHYNDHGSCIANTKTRSVCMAAFSHDDKHLFSVSDDGVVVIRNLHLN